MLEYPRRDVGRQYLSGRADAAGGGEALAAGSRRDIEHPSALEQLGQVEHHVRGLAEPVLKRGAPGIPCRGRAVPLLPRSRLVRDRVEPLLHRVHLATSVAYTSAVQP